MPLLSQMFFTAIITHLYPKHPIYRWYHSPPPRPALVCFNPSFIHLFNLGLYPKLSRYRPHSGLPRLCGTQWPMSAGASIFIPSQVDSNLHPPPPETRNSTLGQIQRKSVLTLVPPLVFQLTERILWPSPQSKILRFTASDQGSQWKDQVF